MAYTKYSSPLLACVQTLVLERPASIRLKDLAEKVGVSRAWLTAFKNGACDNPSALVIEKLYVELTGAQLIGHAV